jgi:hypothetical protein
MSAIPLVVYVTAMIVASSLPWLSLLLYAAVPLLYFVLVTFLRSDSRTRAEARQFS